MMKTVSNGRSSSAILVDPRISTRCYVRLRTQLAGKPGGRIAVSANALQHECFALRRVQASCWNRQPPGYGKLNNVRSRHRRSNEECGIACSHRARLVRSGSEPFCHCRTKAAATAFGRLLSERTDWSKQNPRPWVMAGDCRRARRERINSRR
jgi:hypothetical protein